MKTTVEYTKVLHESDKFIVLSDELDEDRFPADPRIVAVTDVFGREDEHSLNKHRFQWFQHASAVMRENMFHDEDTIRGAYLTEMKEFLKHSLQPSHVFIFNHTIRREGSHPGPVPRFHLDSSIEFASTLASFSTRTRALAKRNIREVHVNAWRPLRAVADWPIAVLDARTLDMSADEVPLIFVSPNPCNPLRSTHYLRCSPAHRFYYRSAMTPEDVLVFKTFDSKTDGRAMRVAHGAMKDPNAAPDRPGRESIEVRAILFFEDESRE